MLSLAGAVKKTIELIGEDAKRVSAMTSVGDCPEATMSRDTYSCVALKSFVADTVFSPASVCNWYQEVTNAKNGSGFADIHIQAWHQMSPADRAHVRVERLSAFLKEVEKASLRKKWSLFNKEIIFAALMCVSILAGGTSAIMLALM